jgi:hypothetical protein
MNLWTCHGETRTPNWHWGAMGSETPGSLQSSLASHKKPRFLLKQFSVWYFSRRTWLCWPYTAFTPISPTSSSTSTATLSCSKESTLSTHLLHRKLVCPHRNAVDKLHGTPQPVKFHTLIHMHNPIAGQRPTPDGVIQKGPYSCQDDFKHRQATAQPLLGEQVPLSCNCNLLQKSKW